MVGPAATGLRVNGTPLPRGVGGVAKAVTAIAANQPRAANPEPRDHCGVADPRLINDFDWSYADRTTRTVDERKHFRQKLIQSMLHNAMRLPPTDLHDCPWASHRMSNDIGKL